LLSALIFILYSGLIAQAQDKEQNKPTKMTTSLDEVHELLSRTIFRLSNRIDSFFGSERADDEANGSRLRMSWETGKIEGNKIKQEANLRLKLVLPETQKRLRIVVERDSDGPPKLSEGKEKQEETPSEAAIRQAAIELAQAPTRWKVGMDTGIRVEIPPNPYARFHITRSAFFGKYELRGSQEFFWYLSDGAGETTRLDLDRPIREGLLFRLGNEATWTDDSDRFSLAHGPVLYHQLSERRGVAYSLRALGTSKPVVHINNYELKLTYRQLIHKNWLFYEFTPLIFFPKDRDWQRTLAVFFKLEMVVGSL
jgi:hypothetical protein